MSDIEVWKPVAGHPGYEVSSLGRVRSIDRVVMLSAGRCGGLRPIERKGAIMRAYPAPNGYLGLTLSGKRMCRVHTMACEAFHGPRPDGHQVAHNDGNRANNRAENLRWATPRENNADKIQHGTNGGRQGEKHPLAKLTEVDVGRIRARIGFLSHKDIAEEFGVSPGTISDIKRGVKWAHIPAGASV